MVKSKYYLIAFPETERKKVMDWSDNLDYLMNKLRYIETTFGIALYPAQIEDSQGNIMS